MANIITFIRLITVFIIGAIALYASPTWQLLDAPLIVTNIVLDGLDGVIARARKETSIFGAVFDITADRIIEITLWLILAEVGLVSIWIAIIFVTRGFLVDSLRKQHANLGSAPFTIMKTNLGKFLVASRTMRFTYGLMKVLTFTWLFLLIPFPSLWPQWWFSYHDACNFLSGILVYSTVAICLARGLPVIFEAILCKD